MGNKIAARASCRAAALALAFVACLAPQTGAAASSWTGSRAGSWAVASAHPLATRAGAEILEAGGNAFDAAAAVSAVLSVVEPYSAGFGGGGFWLLREAKNGREVMLDGRETAPLAATADMYLDAKGKVVPGLSLDGALAAGIPGMPAAVAHLAARYGTLPLERLLRDAIRHAERGFPVDARFVRYAERRRDALSASPGNAFLPRGRAPRAGAVIRQPELAATLRRLAARGRDGFYRGEVAREMVAAVKAAGGIWSLDDLRDYAALEREPVRFTYQGARVVSAALPSSGGVVLAQIFGVLSHLKPDGLPPAQKTHLLIEAMRRAYHDRATMLGDPDFVKMPHHMLDADHIAELARGIAPARATTGGRYAPDGAAPASGRDTTHFSIIDAAGNRVAGTMSLNYLFGSGLVAGDTGVLLNNEMDDFSAAPGVPNLYGLVGGAANAIAPGKRMLSSMSPTFVERDGRVAVLGTPGGSRIITMVLLGMLEFIDGAGAERIVSAKRIHHQYLPNKVFLEPGALSKAIRKRLAAMGHTLEEAEETWGNMQAIVLDTRTGRIEAASDPRGGGEALVGGGK